MTICNEILLYVFIYVENKDFKMSIDVLFSTLGKRKKWKSIL